MVAISLTSRPDRMLVALASKLIFWWPATDRRSDFGFALLGSPEVRFNDGRADPEGNFWVGSMKNDVLPDGELCEAGPGMGVLYRVDPAGGHGMAQAPWHRQDACWSRTAAAFYFADTLAKEIYVYDYADGAITNERVFQAGFDRGAPDGPAIDSAGYLWNCRFGGGCISGSPGTARSTASSRCRSEHHNLHLRRPRAEDALHHHRQLVAPPGDRLAGSLSPWRSRYRGCRRTGFSSPDKSPARQLGLSAAGQ